MGWGILDSGYLVCMDIHSYKITGQPVEIDRLLVLLVLLTPSIYYQKSIPQILYVCATHLTLVELLNNRHRFPEDCGRDVCNIKSILW